MVPKLHGRWGANLLGLAANRRLFSAFGVSTAKCVNNQGNHKWTPLRLVGWALTLHLLRWE
jgi:hypothetical protein